MWEKGGVCEDVNIIIFLKQKKADEMSACLVGSEKYIRDSLSNNYQV